MARILNDTIKIRWPARNPRTGRPVSEAQRRYLAFPQPSISYILRASINAGASQKGAAAKHACDESDRHHSAPAPGRGERSGIAAGSERVPNVSVGWGGGAEPCRADSDPGRARPVTR